MTLAWSLILIVFGLLCWLGQVLSTFNPKLAVRLGLFEPKAEVDATFYLDGSGEALWDSFSLWTLPLAGLLLLLGNPWWVTLGLVGGGMYLYFGGRGIVARLTMQRHGVQLGKAATVNVAYLFLALWGVIGGVTIVMALLTLPAL